MHKCLKCGRMVTDILEIQEGCTCGSKVFVFTRLDDGSQAGAQEVKKREGHVSFLPNIHKQITSFGKAFSKKDAPDEKSGMAKQPGELKKEPAAEKIDSTAPAPASLQPEQSNSSSAPMQAVQTTLEPHLKPFPDAAKPGDPEISDAQPIASSVTEARLEISPKTQPAAVASSIISEDAMDGPGEGYQEVWLAKGGIISRIDAGDLGANSIGIENVRQLSRGVYEVDLSALKDGPLVVKDSDGVYYVRLPFSQPEMKKNESKKG